MVFRRSRRAPVLAIAFLASIWDSHSVHGHSRQMRFVTDPSDEGKPRSARVQIRPFELVLSPTPNGIEEPNEKIIVTALRRVIDKYANEQQLPEGTSFEYVYFDGIQQNKLIQVDDHSGRHLVAQTILVVDGGIASFEVQPGSDPPEQAQVSSWVETAVGKDLIPELEETPLQFIETTEIETLTAAPTQAPKPPMLTQAPKPPIEAGGLSKEHVIERKDSDAGIIAGAVVGSVVAVILAAALFVRRRRKRAVGDTALKTDTDLAEIDIRPIDTPQEPDRYEPYAPSVDARYVDNDSSASVSEWTASSSFTTKTNDTRPSMIGQTESFEMDRQVMLRKDMLFTSPGWNDAQRITIGTNDTLLKPSYFSAKKEAKRRREKAQDMALDSDRKPGDSEDDKSPRPSASDVFVFEANDDGEEVYLMPPNQSIGRRIV